MRRGAFAAIAVALACTQFTNTASADMTGTAAPQIVPLPSSQTAVSGETFTLKPGSKIAVASSDDPALPVAEKLAAILRPSTGFALPITRGDGGSEDIALSLGGASALGTEGYTLKATSAGVKLQAPATGGLFYGVQTLRQLFPVWIESATKRPGPWTIPGTDISDSPRYTYRGVMVDIARHYQTPEAIKRVIDDASAYKVNVLHLHVSDDQGFRIVINGQPELTRVGGQFSINNDPGGFWTQDQYKDVVAYAADHFMSVVPEVDSPGHNNAIIMSYNTGPEGTNRLFPDINCSNRQPASWLLTNAVGYSALCQGTLPGAPNEHTWGILTDIITQLSAMSSSPYYNLGGDEVPAALLSTPNYNAFVDYEQAIVRAKGKIPMGWADISSAGFKTTDPQPAIAQFWANGAPTGSGGDTARVAVQKGMKVVMSPANHTYLDMKQVSGSPIGMTWACTCDLTTHYNWGTTAPTGDPATYIPARTVSTTAIAPTAAGDDRVHVASIASLAPGQTLNIDTGSALQAVTISSVGTAAGANTTLSAAAAAGDSVIKVASINGWVAGHKAIVDTGANLETVTVQTVGTAGAAGTGITLAAPLARAHNSGVSSRDAGTGVQFTPALTAAHATAAAVATTLPAVTDDNIIGVEGPLWSETLRNIQDIEFMAFPRLPALAEISWSPKSAPNRTLASFQSRVATQGPRWQLRSQNFYPTAQAPWGVDVAAANIEQTGTSIDGVLASVAAPGATLAQLSATIDWGDGETSPATLSGTEATNKTANGVYSVSGAHTYARPGGYAAKVTVRKGTTATATSAVTVSIDATADGGAGGTVPATLALSLGSASFGTFTPGVAQDYTASATANVISTAGDAALTVADPSSTNTGRLVNGAFALPQPLQAAVGTAFAPVGGSSAPTLLKTWSGPTSNEAVAISFKQPIAANDALRTGSYSKTLTFTLSTTTP